MPSGARTNTGRWPALTSLARCVRGSTTAATKVANRSSQPLRQKASLIRDTAATRSVSEARQYFTSPDNTAITSAAGTPLPETSAMTTASLPSGSGT